MPHKAKKQKNRKQRRKLADIRNARARKRWLSYGKIFEERRHEFELFPENHVRSAEENHMIRNFMRYRYRKIMEKTEGSDSFSWSDIEDEAADFFGIDIKEARQLRVVYTQQQAVLKEFQKAICILKHEAALRAMRED